MGGGHRALRDQPPAFRRRLRIEILTETPDSPATCAFVRADGSLCPGPLEGEGEMCFWHDPEASKETDDLRGRLQEWAESGESMEGFILRYAVWRVCG